VDGSRVGSIAWAAHLRKLAGIPGMAPPLGCALLTAHDGRA